VSDPGRRSDRRTDQVPRVRAKGEPKAAPAPENLSNESTDYSRTTRRSKRETRPRSASRSGAEGSPYETADDDDALERTELPMNRKERRAAGERGPKHPTVELAYIHPGDVSAAFMSSVVRCRDYELMRTQSLFGVA
jgi:hypothetical protein